MKTYEDIGALMTKVEDIARFILGGNATFTVVSKKTETRYTFKVRQKIEKDNAGVVTKVSPYFVGLLSGPDNVGSYTYLGAIFDEGEHGKFKLTKASKMNDDSIPVRTFRWVFNKAMQGDSALTDGVEFWHEGSCCVCGRKLTVPESIASGIGPVCLAKGRS